MTIIEIDDAIKNIEIHDDSGMMEITFADANYNDMGIVLRFWLSKQSAKMFRDTLLCTRKDQLFREGWEKAFEFFQENKDKPLNWGEDNVLIAREKALDAQKNQSKKSI